MAKKIEFKKKPLKSEETEQKLDQWLEEKTKGETAPQIMQPAQQNGDEAQEQHSSAPEAVKPEAQETVTATAPETAAIKPGPAKGKAKQAVSFEKQEEELEIAQVTFHMPKSLQRRLKFECFRQDTTIKDYVIRLLDKQLPKDTM